MHFRRHHAGVTARARIGRPQAGLRKFLGQVFEDRERFPDGWSPSISTGTLPAGEYFSICSRLPGS